MAASKLLPPLVREPLKMEPATLAEGTTTTITFRVIENRSPNVKISIMVEDTGAAIRDVSSNSGYEGAALWQELPVTLTQTSSELSYGKTFSVRWAGSLSGESILASGKHKLRLKTALRNVLVG